MTPMWQVIVVRAWQHGPHRIIRLTISSGADRVPRTAYATSGRSAGSRLARWLDEQAPDQPSSVDSDAATRRIDGDGQAEEDDA